MAGARSLSDGSQDPIGLGALTDGINAADHALHIAVGAPLQEVAGAVGMNNARGEMAAGMVGNMILAPVDRQLAGLVRKVELAGIAVGVAFGMHPMALACTKIFLRAQLNREIGTAMKEALFGREAEVVQGQKVVAERTRPMERPRAVMPVGQRVGRAQTRRDIRADRPTRPEFDAGDEHRQRRVAERPCEERRYEPPQSRAAEMDTEPRKRDRAVSAPGIDRNSGIGPGSR